MIDRRKAPPIQSVETLSLHRPIQHKLDNGIAVYDIRLGQQEVIKLELVFEAGRWYEHQQLVARACAQLLKAGTKRRSAVQLADFFEHYGAKLDIYDGFNTVNIQLYCLTKHLPTLLPVLQEMLLNPLFPEQEVAQFIKRSRQNLKLQLQKNDVLAYRLFTEELFGNQHPYGYNSFADHYNQLTREQIQQHYERCYTAGSCTIFVAGKTSENTVALLNQYFSDLPQRSAPSAPPWILPPELGHKKVYQVLSEESLQASIRIGRRTFAREHSDCDRFYMMNMVLGGYFGSRLMQNLRERNGYTYGIYSSIETLRHSGYWYIHTDVSKEITQVALTEIYNEIDRLQQAPIATEEMEMVRNYSLGMQLTALDGVFNVASVVKSLVTANLTAQHFYQFIDTIKNITPQDIQLLAQQYLRQEDLLEVVVE
jgi:predicted Zn-dependent peptidase